MWEHPYAICMYPVFGERPGPEVSSNCVFIWGAWEAVTLAGYRVGIGMVRSGARCKLEPLPGLGQAHKQRG